MDTEQRRRLVQRLLELREQGLIQPPAKIEPNRRDNSTSGVADEDAQALSEMHQVLASKRNAGNADLVARIEHALSLATNPDLFGLCEECEEEIPPARLEAIPYATRCIACQAKHDPQRNVRRHSAFDVR